MTVSFKQEKHNCTMLVKIKEDFEDLEKGVNIQMTEGCFYGYLSSSGEYTRHKKTNILRSEDLMTYRKYRKEMQRNSEMYHWDPQARRSRRRDMNIKALDYFDFTFAELFKAVEELVYKDKVKFGEYTVFAKGREFKDIHPDTFFWPEIAIYKRPRTMPR